VGNTASLDNGAARRVGALTILLWILDGLAAGLLLGAFCARFRDIPPIVASVWRELVPNYTVRDVFSAKREEVRQRAAGMITQKLAADGIVVKEVMLRDIQLPEEYAKGLETLLLKEQENDRMGVETELKQKQVRISELEADAD